MYQGFKTINDAIQETLDYIEARRNGSIKSIKSKWNKLNKVFLNGYEWGTINIIAGLSSSGKTLLIDQLEQSFIDLNKDQEFIVINFNFEMTAKNLILRKLSSKKKLTLKQLLSADEDYKLSEGELNDIRAELSLMVSDNIFYFEKPQTNNEMFKTIEKMWNQYHKPMIVFLDHSILIKKSASESSYLDMLYNSAEMFNSLKKQFPIIIFIVSQLNREIEAVERKQRPSTLNYPIKADIWGSKMLAS